jgi:hypothetical protein
MSETCIPAQELNTLLKINTIPGKLINMNNTLGYGDRAFQEA